MFRQNLPGIFSVCVQPEIPLDGGPVFEYTKYRRNGCPVRRKEERPMTDMTTGEELDYTPDLITLLDEDNNEHEFEVIDAVDHGDEHYLALVPYSADPESLDEDAELLIMRVDVDEENEEYLSIVDDDEELYTVGKIFAERLEEFFDIENG